MTQYTVVGLEDVAQPSVVFITVDEADEQLAALRFLTTSPKGSVLAINEGINNAIVDTDDSHHLIPLLLYIRSIDLKDRKSFRGSKRQIDRLYELGFLDSNESQISFTALAKGIFTMFDYWLSSEVTANTAIPEVPEESIEEGTAVIDEAPANGHPFPELPVIFQGDAIPLPMPKPLISEEEQEVGIAIGIPAENFPAKLVELAKQVQSKYGHPDEELIDWPICSKVIEDSGIVTDESVSTPAPVVTEPPINPVRRDPFGGVSDIKITRKVKL